MNLSKRRNLIVIYQDLSYFVLVLHGVLVWFNKHDRTFRIPDQ